MPFKTRKRKESAKERRFSISPEGTVSYAAFEKTSQTKISANLQRTASIEDDYSYVFGDLRKIFLAAGLIVGIQLVLKLTNFTLKI